MECWKMDIYGVTQSLFLGVLIVASIFLRGQGQIANTGMIAFIPVISLTLQGVVRTILGVPNLVMGNSVKQVAIAQVRPLAQQGVVLIALNAAFAIVGEMADPVSFYVRVILFLLLAYELGYALFIFVELVLAVFSAALLRIDAESWGADPERLSLSDPTFRSVLRSFQLDWVIVVFLSLLSMIYLQVPLIFVFTQLLILSLSVMVLICVRMGDNIYLNHARQILILRWYAQLITADCLITLGVELGLWWMPMMFVIVTIFLALTTIVSIILMIVTILMIRKRRAEGYTVVAFKEG